MIVDVLYNGAQLALWAAVMFVLASRAAGGAVDAVALGAEPLGLLVLVAQGVGAVDVYRAAVGATRSNVAVVALQQFGRLLVLKFVVDDCRVFHSASYRATVAADHVVPWLVPHAPTVRVVLIATYALSDVIRLAYFTLRSAGLDVPLLHFLRYNAFLVLYPIGLLAEPASMLLATSCAAEWGRAWSLVLWLFIIAFPAIAAALFTNMLKQRAKQARQKRA